VSNSAVRFKSEMNLLPMNRVQNRILTQQEKNIETVAFGLIAVIKIGKEILDDKKSLLVQDFLLLIILGAALFGTREMAGSVRTENNE